MEEPTMSFNEGDRISQLPDEILINILCRLPLTNAAASTVLSKRWQHLFPSLPSFRIDMSSADVFVTRGPSSDQYISSMRRIFHSRRSSGSPIKIVDICADADTKKFDSIFRSLCSNGIKELTVSAAYDSSNYQIPIRIFSCHTLMKMAFRGFVLRVPRKFTGLGRLRHLEIGNTSIKDVALKRILSFCPQIEELILDHCRGIKNLVISSHNSLARLRIHSHYNFPAIRITECPRLTSVAVLRRIDMYDEYDDEYDSEDDDLDEEELQCGNIWRLARFLGRLSQVTSLTLSFSGDYFDDYEDFEEVEPVPKSLPNGKCLSDMKELYLKLPLLDERFTSILMCLLNSCPNLKHLTVGVFDGRRKQTTHALDFSWYQYSRPYGDDYIWNCPLPLPSFPVDQTPPECIMNRLRTATLFWDDNYNQSQCIQFAMFILMNGSVLQKMTIKYLESHEHAVVGSVQKYLVLEQKASSSVEIELIATRSIHDIIEDTCMCT
ncbi:F-box/FBD/LRR-repeat protein [Canna indica]|uniref:F-box/FBD/LRR-repeat protein n=1 Tax=Canna indica TaxID=4628 RepID=A0AAQ3L8M0_9LILI|nr:F-box/FBD/LRR-repeat protein [Canna indica]